MKTSIWLASAFVAQLVGCGAWTVTATPPVAAVEITAAPVADIELYPNTIYEGRSVYLYNNRWYYRDGSEWRYYRQEPPGLADHRYRFERQPPPYVDIPAPPPNIERYPSAIYAGRPTYFYDNRWYYRDGQRWRYYRNEPPPLMQHRQQRHAPPPPPANHDHHQRF